jgi:putative transcriptional regulator
MFEKFEELKGVFLMATPSMPDKRFKKTVIFLVEAKQTNAFGFVISDILTDKFKNRIKDTMFDGMPIYYGGPVDESQLFVIHSADCMWSQSLRIKDVIITKLSDAINEQKMPEKCRIVAGYANWRSGQLTNELLGSWIVFDGKSMEILFDKASTNRWSKCMQASKINPIMINNCVGNA